MSKNYVVEPLVDFGMAIEQAEHESGKSIRSVQRTNYYAAGIRVATPEGQITCSADRHFNVDFLFGPADIDAKSGAIKDFANRVTVLKLHFNPFTHDAKAGRWSRGSLTMPPAWHGVCAGCGAVVAANRLFRQKRAGKGAVCKRCGAKDSFKSQKLPVKRLDVASSELATLYAMHNAGGAQAARLKLPRAWALYREGRTPTEWVPHVDDSAAMNIAIRASDRGMEIRPAQHAIASQSSATSGFVLEGTGGFRFGWLTHKELCGETIELCGYKLQAATLFARKGGRLTL